MKFLQLFFSLVALCLMFACSDPCDDLNCGTGLCIDGTCDCPEGFSGVNCEIENLCFNSMCLNGSCNQDTGTCDCNEGFIGVNCEIEDLCYNSMCVNGSCNQDTGSCDCNEGYEGDNCDVLVIDKFLGTWFSADFECDGAFNPITFIIEQGSSITDLYFYSEFDPETKFELSFNGTTLIIPSQIIDGDTITGAGSLNANNTMNLYFEVTDNNGNSFLCSGLFTKQ